MLDAHDALRTRRPYKPPLSKAETLGTLGNEAGEGKWDPRVMEAFLALMSRALPLEESYAQDFERAQG